MKQATTKLGRTNLISATKAARKTSERDVIKRSCDGTIVVRTRDLQIAAEMNDVFRHVLLEDEYVNVADLRAENYSVRSTAYLPHGMVGLGQGTRLHLSPNRKHLSRLSDGGFLAVVSLLEKNSIPYEGSLRATHLVGKTVNSPTRTVGRLAAHFGGLPLASILWASEGHYTYLVVMSEVDWIECETLTRYDTGYYSLIKTEDVEYAAMLKMKHNAVILDMSEIRRGS